MFWGELCEVHRIAEQENLGPALYSPVSKRTTALCTFRRKLLTTDDDMVNLPTAESKPF